MDTVKGEEAKPEARVEVRRAPFGKLTIYEISEDELAQLERGAPAALDLSFFVFFFSVGATFLSVLLSVPIASPIAKAVYIMVVVLFPVLGLYFLCRWARARKSAISIANTIRKRLPPEGEPEQQRA